MKNCVLIFVFLLLVPCVFPNARADDWAAISQKAVQGGLLQEQVSPVVERARRAGYTADQASALLQPVVEARKQNLPTRPILDKIEEGLVKQVQPVLLTQASRNRQMKLVQASKVLEEAGSTSESVLYAVTLALESGLPEATLVTVLKNGRGKSPGQLQAIVEAGETMHLNGMEEASIQVLMTDCLDRNLRRSEVLRTTRYACQQHRAGMQGNNIRKSLWGQARGNGPGQGQRRHDGSGGGESRGAGGPDGHPSQGLHEPGTGNSGSGPGGPR